MNKNILLKYRFRNNEVELDERILKLDQWNLMYGRDTEDPTMYHFNRDVNRAMQMASLVVYKKDWDNPNCPLQVIKFRYPQEDLDNYLELLKKFPIFVPNNNDKEYDWIRNLT